MRILFITILFFAFSCNQKHEKKSESIDLNKSIESVRTEKQTSINSKKEANLWVDQFKEFRLALFHKDKNKLDQFFDFPFQSDKNELWILIDDKGFESFEENQAKPISKELFYKNLDRIFPKEFIQLLLKVKSDSLRIGKEYEISSKDNLEQLFFSFSSKSLTITHNIVFIYDNETNDLEDDVTTDSSTMYHFQITKSGQLKFISISLAG
jgi:hypothetical protein